MAKRYLDEFYTRLGTHTGRCWRRWSGANVTGHRGWRIPAGAGVVAASRIAAAADAPGCLKRVEVN